MIIEIYSYSKDLQDLKDLLTPAKFKYSSSDVNHIISLSKYALQLNKIIISPILNINKISRNEIEILDKDRTNLIKIYDFFLSRQLPKSSELDECWFGIQPEEVDKWIKNYISKSIAIFISIKDYYLLKLVVRIMKFIRREECASEAYIFLKEQKKTKNNKKTPKRKIERKRRRRSRSSLGEKNQLQNYMNESYENSPKGKEIEGIRLSVPLENKKGATAQINEKNELLNNYDMLVNVTPIPYSRVANHSSETSVAKESLSEQESDVVRAIQKRIDFYKEELIEGLQTEKFDGQNLEAILGNPKSYKFKDISSITHGSSPCPGEELEFIGLKEELLKNIDGIDYCIFINALANAGYVDNTIDNLDKFSFRLSGRTNKDRQMVKEGKARLLPVGSSESATPKAIWYILMTIGKDPSKKGGSHKDEEKPIFTSKYKKATQLFCFEDSENQNYFVSERFKQTVNMYRAESRVKALVELVFNVKPKNEKKK